MVKRILAPIDAREASEKIVPVVAALARDAGSTVRLLRVLPVPTQVIGNHGRIAQHSCGRLVDQHLTWVCQVLAGGGASERRAGQHVEQLNGRIADDEAPGWPAGDGDFERQRGGCAIRQGGCGKLPHGILERESAGNRQHGG